MRRSRKYLLATLVVVVGLGAAAYAAAPRLLETIAARALSGTVEIRELKIDSVGLSRLEVGVIRVDNKQVRLDAQQTVVRYDLWPFALHGIDIERAHLAVSGMRSGDGEATAMPAPPPFPLRIDELVVDAGTPWGAVSFPAAISTSPGAAGGIEARVRGPDFSLSLTNPSENRHILALLDAAQGEMLSLNARTGGPLPADIDGRVEPGKIMRWVAESDVIPPGIKDMVAPFGVDGTSIRFGGTIREDNELSARVYGELMINDQRAAGERLFDSIQVQSESGHTITRSGAAWSGSGDASFRFALNPETTLTGRHPAWRWNEGTLGASAEHPELAELGLIADWVDATASGITAVGARGDVHLRGARMSTWPEGLNHYEVSGNWSWQHPAFDLEGTATGAALPGLDWTLQASGEQGSINAAGHQEVAALAPVLDDYTRAIARELEINAGELDVSYRLDWDANGEKTALSARTTPVDADLDEMEVRGLSVRLENRGNTLERLGLSVTAPSLKLAAGTVAEDFEMNLGLAYPELRIDSARARLFGGEIAVRPATLDLENDEFVLFGDITGLSLQRVMALFDMETTELSGTVAGPVRVLYHKDTGIEINEGKLTGTEPGTLRFTLGPDSAAAAQFDNIALRALEDFQYRDLNASVLYKPDGEYRIAARIVGSNPQVLDGHPIALNPTIEGRLPALFRAFFVTGDFNQAIIERLREERALSTPE